MQNPLRRVMFHAFSIISCAALLIAALPARAANPPLMIVSPLEWNLPIVPSANVILQNVIMNTNNEAYDINAPGGQTYIGVTRYAHLFSYGKDPSVGYFWEFLQPYVVAQGTSFEASGLADPTFDFGVITKKRHGFVLVPQLLLGVPIGDNNLSNHFWAVTPLLGFNWMTADDQLSFTGNLAYTWTSTRHVTGEPDLKPGRSTFASLIMTWMATKTVQPFIRYDYNHTGGTWNIQDAQYTRATTTKAPQASGCASISTDSPRPTSGIRRM
ncbi:MAG: transporter [Acidobacteriota bacterium]